MKSISIRQPHASLIANELKRYETRSWQTSYRGPLLICASQTRMTIEARKQLVWDSMIPVRFWHFFLQASDPALTCSYIANEIVGYDYQPFGRALCIVDLETVIRIAFNGPFPKSEVPLGVWSPGHFAWQLDNVRRFVEPWPVKGRLGLFEVPDEEIKKHEVAGS